jgi:putative endonuclease
MYTVYVLYSQGFDKIYIGYTRDREQRLKSHNELANKGWTVNFRPRTIVHQEQYESKAEAMRREKELKTFRGREWIRNLLNTE